MSDSFYDPKSPKRTVSLTLNSDLYAKAKRMGINASKVAEEALVRASACEPRNSESASAR